MQNPKETIDITQDLPEGAVIDSDGNVIENPTTKQLAVIQLSHIIFNDEDLLTKALNHCLEGDNQNMTMEEYVGKPGRFRSFLNRYPEIRKEYESNLAKQRSDNVAKAKERQLILRNKRRNSKR